MCYVKHGKASLECSHFQCFSCEELRISDQGIITEPSGPEVFAVRNAPNMFETLGILMRV